MSRRLMGIDLSYTSTGVAWTTGGDPAVRTRTIATTLAGLARVGEILSALTLIVDHGIRPKLAFKEAPFANENSGVTVKLAKLHGVVEQWLWARGIECVDVAPATLKVYATGNGGAEKDEVLHAARNQWGQLCGGPTSIDTTDAADAMTALALGSHALGVPLAPVPARNTRALVTIRAALRKLPRFANEVPL